ncbi:MAG TPA: carboxypeptidase regulatory-like domain-containing protein [Anaeromyxobacteraceae bacterium]|nr:carboxypeptidase regulatory-like domain-containing protein [Anaeromyxobacteraceae bacterium]
MRTLVLVAVLCVAPAVSAGEVKGVVRYTGPVPDAAPLRATKDQPTCGEAVPDDSLLVSGGLLANAVVSVGAIPGVQPAPLTVVLDQRRCRFVPRVLTAPVGSTVDVVNSDPILHNAHGWNGKATVFNVPMPTEGQRAPKPLRKPGLVKVGCDVHGWMGAWIFVAEGPAAVSAADGSYRLAGVPAGTYTVKVWHERLGEQTAQVTVPAAGEATLDFAFSAR